MWDARDRRLLFVDILAGEVHRLDPESGRLETIAVGEPVGAVAPRSRGGLVLATRDGFAGLEGDALTPLHAVREEAPGARMNDGKCDRAGRFWAGTQSDAPEQRRGGLYRLDGAGVGRVLNGVGISNGLDWSIDGSTFYYVDSESHGIDTFDFDVDSGTLSGRRRFVDVPPELGLADGLTVDAEGGIWLAIFFASRIHRYTPEGRLDAVVEFPVSLVTSCAFGGDELADLYVTSAAHRLRDPEPLAGALFRLDVGVSGRPSTPFAH
jgi:sugar lactone lactonase YvrE